MDGWILSKISPPAYLNEPRIIDANDGTHHIPWVQARVNAAAVQ
ncbi:hypothetical protein [Sphingorhabdus sp.]|jgi:hypothetical protein